MAGPSDDVTRTDGELLVAWQGGDAQAGQRLWERHGQLVLHFFSNKAPHEQMLDLTQETFIALLQCTRPVRSMRSYLIGIAQRKLVDHLRAESRRRRRSGDLESLVVGEVFDGPDVWVGARREHRLLLQALRELPLPVQIALELQFWERMSGSEIAELLGEPIGTISSRLRAGHLRLKAAIERLSTSPTELRSTLDTLAQWAERTRRSAEEHAERRRRERAPGTA